MKPKDIYLYTKFQAKFLRELEDKLVPYVASIIEKCCNLFNLNYSFEKCYEIKDVIFTISKINTLKLSTKSLIRASVSEMPLSNPLVIRHEVDMKLLFNTDTFIEEFKEQIINVLLVLLSAVIDKDSPLKETNIYNGKEFEF